MISLGLYDGETPHSFRAGCALLLETSGVAKDKQDLMQHIGWKCEKSARYYARSQLLADAGRVAKGLAVSVNDDKVESFYNAHVDV